jgi:hypothetical protein
MPALPAVTKTYSARGNVPYTNVLTTLAVAQSAIWALKEHMKNTAVGGSTSGTRHANSVWTVRYSCDSVTAGVAGDGVDRWTTFANLIWNSSGSAHSWIVLRNTTLGYEVCIDLNSASSASARIAVAEIATPFTGGTTTTGPTATNEFLAGTTSIGASSNFQWQGDSATGNFNWTHYITADDGQFYFVCSRTGLGYFSTFIAVQKTTAASPSDTRNVFALGAFASGARGAPSVGSLINTASGCVGRFPNGAVNTTGGIQSAGRFGATDWPGSIGIDSVTGNYLAFPHHVGSLGGAQPSYRGVFPDQYSIATAPVGGAIPSAAAQERVVVGDIIMPYPGVNPII